MAVLGVLAAVIAALLTAVLFVFVTYTVYQMDEIMASSKVLFHLLQYSSRLLTVDRSSSHPASCTMVARD